MALTTHGQNGHILVLSNSEKPMAGVGGLPFSEFIGFGAMGGNFPYDFIGFGPWIEMLHMTS